MRVGIIKLSSLGDIIHALSILPLLQKDGLIIEWFVDEKFADILQDSPLISKIHKIPISKIKKERSLKLALKTIKYLRSLPKYDMVIDMQGLLKSALVLSFLNKKTSVGFGRRSAKEGLASLFYDKKIEIPYSEHIIKRNKKILSSALDVEIAFEDIINQKPFISFSNDAKGRAESLIEKSSKKNIALFIEASKDSKIYPIERFIELANMFEENLYIIYHQKEEDAKRLENSSHARLLPKMSMDELKATISMMDLLIGGDSGPTHLAWASGVASITIFGVTPMERFCIGSEKNRCISAKNLGVETIKDIDPNIIYKNAREILHG